MASEKPAEKRAADRRQIRVDRRKRRRRKAATVTCHCCGQSVMFCWGCRCGFAMCQTCMYENQWGMTCNGITWTCPDCGAQNGYGNQ